MSKQEWYFEDSEWAKKLTDEYEEYMWDMELHIADVPEELDIPLVEPLSGEPFDGCQDCYTREQLFFLVPRIIRGYKEGKLFLAEDDK
jgi:hypothetical protein